MKRMMYAVPLLCLLAGEALAQPINCKGARQHTQQLLSELVGGKESLLQVLLTDTLDALSGSSTVYPDAIGVTLKLLDGIKSELIEAMKAEQVACQQSNPCEHDANDLGNMLYKLGTALLRFLGGNPAGLTDLDSAYSNLKRLGGRWDKRCGGDMNQSFLWDSAIVKGLNDLYKNKGGGGAARGTGERIAPLPLPIPIRVPVIP